MGSYVPSLVSPITGERAGGPVDRATCSRRHPGEPGRWQRWWQFANVEQLSTFVLITFLTITSTSMLAYATAVRPRRPGQQHRLPADRGPGAGRDRRAVVRVLFWVIGAFSLFAAALGIVDYTTRLLRTCSRRPTCATGTLHRDRLYACLVLGIVADRHRRPAGRARPAAGAAGASPAASAGVMMFMYSILLLVMNRTALPDSIKVRSYRIAALIWSTLFFGFMAVLALNEQLRKLF